MNCEHCSKEFVDSIFGLIELQFHILIEHENTIKEMELNLQ